MECVSQYDHIETVRCEAVQPVVDVFLNHIETLAYRGHNIFWVDVDSHANDIALITQAREKITVSATEVQHATTCGYPVKNRVEVETVHNGPTRCIHCFSNAS